MDWYDPDIDRYSLEELEQGFFNTMLGHDARYADAEWHSRMCVPSPSLYTTSAHCSRPTDLII